MYSTSNDDSYVKQLFLAEIQEALQNFEQELLALERRPMSGSQAFRTLQRLAHSIKGAASMAKATHLSQSIHAVEDTLTEVVPVWPELTAPEQTQVLSQLLQSLDGLNQDLALFEQTMHTAPQPASNSATTEPTPTDTDIDLSLLDDPMLSMASTDLDSEFDPGLLDTSSDLDDVTVEDLELEFDPGLLDTSLNLLDEATAEFDPSWLDEPADLPEADLDSMELDLALNEEDLSELALELEFDPSLLNAGTLLTGSTDPELNSGPSNLEIPHFEAGSDLDQLLDVEPHQSDSAEDQALITIFFNEAREFSQLLMTQVQALRQPTVPNISQLFRELIRSAHSLKGSAAMFGRGQLAAAMAQIEEQFKGIQLLWSAWTVEQHQQWFNQIQPILELVVRIVEADQSGLETDPSLTELSLALGQLPQLEISEVDQPQPQSPSLLETMLSRDFPPLIAQLKALCQLEPSNEISIQESVPDVLELLQKLNALSTMLQLSELQTAIDPLELITAQALFDESSLVTLPEQWLSGIATIETVSQQLLTDLKQAQPEVQPSDPNLEAIEKVPEPGPLTPIFSRVDARRLDAVMNLVGELIIQRTYLDQERQDLNRLARQTKLIMQQMRQINQQLRESYDQLNIGQGSASLGSNSHDFDSLEWDRHTQVHEAAHHLMESSALLREKIEDLAQIERRMEQTGTQFNRICAELSNQATRLRVAPFSQIVTHLPRAIRDLCKTYQKSVELVIYGGEVEIDEQILYQLQDPITHLVRNAFDHGIESPDERQTAGKPTTGRIEIEARHSGSRTLITIQDDGRGIDPERIRQKAIHQGLYTTEQAEALTEAELHRLLFVPEFSTADQVTQLSGRGVGLDIVEAALIQLRGDITLQTRLGHGTTFTLGLPLVLSIMPALLVRVERDILAIPQDRIIQIMRITPEELQQTDSSASNLQVHWQDQALPAFRIPELLRYHIPHPDQGTLNPLTVERTKIPVVILKDSTTNKDSQIQAKAAVLVDQLIGQQDIVLKALPSGLPQPVGVSGATVLGTGRVVLVLDPDQLLDQASHYQESPLATEIDIPMAQRILVVDDAYSVRSMIVSTLSRAGYQVEQAQDGRVAVSRLAVDPNYQAIITDLEMPRLDGFGLLRHLQSQPHLAQIPTIVLTSRSASKYREKALELQAKGYLTKPFQKRDLLTLVEQLINA